MLSDQDVIGYHAFSLLLLSQICCVVIGVLHNYCSTVLRSCLDNP